MPRALRGMVAVLVALVVAPLGACSDDGSGSDEAFCGLLEQNQDRYLGVFDGFTDITRKDEAHLRLAAAAGDLAELREAAPGELHDELDRLIATIAAMDAAVDAIEPGDRGSVDAAFEDVRADAEPIEAAGATLETFRQTRCQAPPTQGG
jgi:hypothetical protein